jgi:integrase
MTLAADFGPLAFKTLRAKMVELGWNRKTINDHCQRVKRVIRWAVENELLPSDRWEALRAVRGLARGRTEAPEPIPRKPADPALFRATLPHLPPMLAAAARLIYLTGARPSEILRMRPCELDRSGAVWTLTPERHKGTWRGSARVLYLGPEAQTVLTPWLLKTPGQEEFIFSPARPEAERQRTRSENRVVKPWPSHAKLNKVKRKARRYKPYYDKDALNRAVLRACEKAKVEPWTPYQLRHLRAVELREEFGLEHARAVLGHAYASMSDHYSKAADRNLAAAVAAKIG